MTEQTALSPLAARFAPSLKDKLILITGAGRGIGKRLAIGFANAGALVALVARSRAQLDLAHLEIEHSGGSSERFAGDVRDREFLSTAVDRAMVRFRRPVDGLICAAGVQGPIGPLTDSDPKAWWETLEVNLQGTALAIRAVLPNMAANRRGKILALTGGGVDRPRPNFSAYAASKAAIARMVECVAAEVEHENIQVNCMSPGGSYTAMTDEILRAGERAGQRDLEDARHIRTSGGVNPDRQLELAFFLTSPQSNHVSGRTVHVNDDWQHYLLREEQLASEVYTLRRVKR